MNTNKDSRISRGSANAVLSIYQRLSAQICGKSKSPAAAGL
jgi:hypothetical protein